MATAISRILWLNVDIDQSSPLDQILLLCPHKLSCCHLIVTPILMVLIRELDYQKPRDKLVALKGWCHWQISFRTEKPWSLFNQHNAAHRYSFGTINCVGWRSQRTGGQGWGQGCAQRPGAKAGDSRRGSGITLQPTPDQHPPDTKWPHTQASPSKVMQYIYFFKSSTDPGQKPKAYKIVSYFDLLKNKKMEKW